MMDSPALNDRIALAIGRAQLRAILAEEQVAQLTAALKKRAEQGTQAEPSAVESSE